METKSLAKGATSSLKGVAQGAIAGLTMGISQAVAGGLIGTLLGAVLAGMILKSQREMIAFLAGWMLVAGAVGSSSAQTSSGANGGVL